MAWNWSLLAKCPKTLLATRGSKGISNRIASLPWWELCPSFSSSSQHGLLTTRENLWLTFSSRIRPKQHTNRTHRHLEAQNLLYIPNVHHNRWSFLYCLLSHSFGSKIWDPYIAFQQDQKPLCPRSHPLVLCLLSSYGGIRWNSELMWSQSHGAHPARRRVHQCSIRLGCRIQWWPDRCSLAFPSCCRNWHRQYLHFPPELPLYYLLLSSLW